MSRYSILLKKKIEVYNPWVAVSCFVPGIALYIFLFNFMVNHIKTWILFIIFFLTFAPTSAAFAALFTMIIYFVKGKFTGKKDLYRIWE